MKITEHHDEIIRRVKAFRNYDRICSEIVSENDAVCNDRRLLKPIYCGVFTAKVYVNNRILGTYTFDCRHFRDFMSYDVLLPRLTREK